MYRIEGLWRYPVKSLAGEPIASAALTATGIPGDRIVHVRGPEGVRTSRRQHRMLGHHGTLGPAGEPLVDGHPWDSAEALALVKTAAGEDAWLASYDGAELHVGAVVIGLDSLRGRCPMTTVDPDSLVRDPEVLRDIGRRFGGRLALNAEVLKPGTITVGDPVRLVRAARGEHP